MLLYLHIPFCHRICPYCSFYKHTPGGTPIGKFIDALLKEVTQKLGSGDLKPKTLYLGGGTPSMLSVTHLEKLFRGLQAVIDFSTLDEISMEANPATFDLDKAMKIKELGVTRVSLGIQSFDAEVLKTLGREHSPDQAIQSVKILREAGIAQANIDLMFSIPNQTQAVWQATLATAISLQPDHVSAYNLTYEEDTAFFESLKRGECREDEDCDAEMFYLAHDALVANGFDHYETSNYARSGVRSQHNSAYWRGEDYIGFGPSAVSTVNGVRWKNVADTASYMTQIESVGHAMGEVENLDAEDLRLERMAIGLRTSAGIPEVWVRAEAQAYLEVLIDEGLIKRENGRLVVAHRGRALVDPIAAELI